MTKFNVSYSPNFRDKKLVEEIINKWNNGAKKFNLSSSGSTGLPKEISLDRELLIWSSEGTRRAILLRNERVLCCIPVNKIGGFMQLIRALIFGWNIHFEVPSSRPFRALQNQSFTLSSLTPQQIKASLKYDAGKLAKIDKVLIGGAPLDPATTDQLKELGNLYWETYGMTETASHIALKQIGRANYFKPQDGVLTSQKEGCLMIKIPTLNLFIQTNDIVHIKSDASFEIIGRKDNVINSGGIKIHPTIVEDHIKKILKSKNIQNDFYITKKNDPRLGEIAVLIVDKSPIINDLQLLSELKQSLSKYTAPKEIIYVNKISYTETYKKIRLSYEQLSSDKRIIRAV